jgi:F-type H+-transporting ATPase subunit epsilon
MAYAPFHLTITNVAGPLFDGEATLVSVPSTLGKATILAHHEPLIALLEKGVIECIDREGKTETFEIERGVLEVSNNRAIILV